MLFSYWDSMITQPQLLSGTLTGVRKHLLLRYCCSFCFPQKLHSVLLIPCSSPVHCYVTLTFSHWQLCGMQIHRSPSAKQCTCMFAPCFLVAFSCLNCSMCKTTIKAKKMTTARLNNDTFLVLRTTLRHYLNCWIPTYMKQGWTDCK